MGRADLAPCRDPRSAAAGPPRPPTGSAAARPGSRPSTRQSARRAGVRLTWPPSNRPSTRSPTLERYKHGFVTDIDQEFAPKGLSEDTVRFISAKKDEPEWMLDWRLEAYRALAGAGRARLGQGRLPAIDYQDAYYYAAPKEKDRPEQPGRGRSGAAGHLRQARHPAEGAGGPGRRRGRAAICGRRGVRQRLGGHHLQEGAGRGRGDLLLDERGDPRASASWCASTWARWCRCRTTISPASTARSSPTAASSMCRRACAARWSCRPISASTPPSPASSSAP